MRASAARGPAAGGMPTVERDISWDMLRQVVRDWAGADADLREAARLDGGSVSTTLALTLAGGRRAVLKITPHRVDRAYADEAHQLALLRAAGVPTPDVYAVHTGSLDRPYSYLLLQFVDGVDLRSAKSCCAPEQFDALQRQLADVLLRLHATPGTHYMRARPEPEGGDENGTGEGGGGGADTRPASAADTPRFDAWPDFHRHLFDDAWREVAKSNVLPVKLRKTVGKVHDRLDRLLARDDVPRLLHGDLWSTNLLAAPLDATDAGGPWRLTAVLDPNGKFGCPEAELAYLDLFRTATPAFFKAYQADRRLPAEYHAVRKPVYQLYSLLNHVRVFGHEYAKALCAQAEKVAAFV
ncbi:MAG: fructosamine kinase [Phycisphaerales bacterium]|nr:fructosamine kinase [Phycisphaerales bacterium]